LASKYHQIEFKTRTKISISRTSAPIIEEDIKDWKTADEAVVKYTSALARILPAKEASAWGFKLGLYDAMTKRFINMNNELAALRASNTKMSDREHAIREARRLRTSSVVKPPLETPDRKYMEMTTEQALQAQGFKPSTVSGRT